MPADPLRERLRAKIEEWRAEGKAEGDPNYDPVVAAAEATAACADQLAALLAESEPEPSRSPHDAHDEARPCSQCGECNPDGSPKPEPDPPKLGHPFTPYKGYFVDTEVCIFLGCGRGREAH